MLLCTLMHAGMSVGSMQGKAEQDRTGQSRAGQSMHAKRHARTLVRAHTPNCIAGGACDKRCYSSPYTGAERTPTDGDYRAGGRQCCKQNGNLYRLT